MAIVVTDNFTDASGTDLAAHTPDLNGPWVNDSGAGALRISNSNRVRMDSGSNALWRCGPVQSTPDYDVAMLITQITALGNIGVVGRLVAGALTFYMGRYNGANTWQLYRCVSNTFFQLGTNATATLGIGDEIRLKMRGDQVSLLRNGSELIAPVSDALIPDAGYGGVRMNGGSDTTGYHGDAFLIETAEEPPPPALGHVSSTSIGAGELWIPDGVSTQIGV